MTCICNLCNKEYSTASNLVKHQKIKHGIVKNLICECERQFDNAQALNAHYRWCSVHRNGKQIVPSGFKGKTSPFRGMVLEDIVSDPKETKRKMSASQILRAQTRPQKLSADHKRKLSIARTNYLENTPHVKWFEVAGIKVQGGWEQRVAQFLVEENIKFSRVRICYDGHRRYTPDFYLEEFDIYLEVKGWMKDYDIEKYVKVLRDNKVNIKLLMGIKNLESFLNKDISLSELPTLNEYLNNINRN